MIDTNIFPKGTHIVLLSSCDGSNVWGYKIPNNYIYKLRGDSSTFNLSLEKDAVGGQNGWSTVKPSVYNKMRLRAATPEEIAAYEKYGPCSVEKAKEFIFEHEIY